MFFIRQSTLVPVATDAKQLIVFQDILPTMRLGNNMIDIKHLIRIIILTLFAFPLFPAKEYRLRILPRHLPTVISLGRRSIFKVVQLRKTSLKQRTLINSTLQTHTNQIISLPRQIYSNPLATQTLSRLTSCCTTAEGVKHNISLIT